MNTATPELLFIEGMPAVHLRAPDGAQASVLLHGAQVLSWIPAGGEERLFVSESAVYVEGKPVRGGVPVIFPQFEQRGPLPRHGFARDRRWKLRRAETGTDDAMVLLGLVDDEVTRALWPHAFELELTVVVCGNRLDIELEVQDTGEESFSFTAALHTYLRVNEVEDARLGSLRGTRYQDALQGGKEQIESQGTIGVQEELDRIYFDAPRALRLSEPRRDLAIELHEFPDLVVWNPWEAKSAAMADMPPLGFRHMLCVEAAVIGRPVRLEPGQDWWGRQTLYA